MLVRHTWLVAPAMDSTDLEPSLIAESSVGQRHVRSAIMNASETRVNHAFSRHAEYITVQMMGMVGEKVEDCS